MVKYLQFKRRNGSRRENHQNLRPNPKTARLVWSPRFKSKTYEIISKYWAQTQDSWGPASDFTRRKSHKKSASESFAFRNILSVESETQGSTSRRRPEQIKAARVTKPAPCLSTQELCYSVSRSKERIHTRNLTFGRSTENKTHSPPPHEEPSIK